MALEAEIKIRGDEEARQNCEIEDEVGAAAYVKHGGDVARKPRKDRQHDARKRNRDDAGGLKPGSRFVPMYTAMMIRPR